MTKIASSLFLAILLILGLHVASAQAQLVRTCVSLAKGNDANASSNCHCTTPCRTFATAHNNTLADGEITVLDPGDYGGLTITKSISINNDSGGEASITVSGNTTGIIVNAPAAGYVNLRGITIQGVGFGTTTGLRFNTGLFLTVTNCVIRNHTGNGIEFSPTASSNLVVSNTSVADNGGDGIRVQPAGTSITAKAVFDRVEASNNSQQGILVLGNGSTGTINATAVDTAATNNVNSGFVVNSLAGQASTSLVLVRSVAANNSNIGVNATGASAIVRLGQSTVTGNTHGWSAVSGGVVQSYVDNNIDGNVTGEAAPPVIVLK